MLAELGADVVVVEPPGGSPLRDLPPFVDDEPGSRAEPSLVGSGGRCTAASPSTSTDADDLATFAALVDDADIVLEGQGHGLDGARRRVGRAPDDHARADLGVDHPVRAGQRAAPTTRPPT